ncbi:MAG: FKBP-type peptidyl-prolyl cis-trans isomerase [Treponema sp.]|nr:FKBP-type peptidyl-prolyl cis-trans isomerase [Treponema sp.]
MKNIAFLALLLAFLGMEAQARGIRDDVNLAGQQARESYAFGMMVGSDFGYSGIELDYAAFMEGLIAAMGGDPAAARMDRAEALALVQNALEASAEREALVLRGREEAFLASNSLAPGVLVTDSGLQYVPIREGEGQRPGPWDTVLVHYEGTLLDGTVFDSSLERGFPETIPLELVIPGWAEALQLMTVGSEYRFYIPSALAYGPQGVGQAVPPYSTLVFTIELLSIYGD